MITEQDCKVIVMLSTSPTDSVKYWPKIAETEKYGTVSVTVLTEETTGDYTVRKLVIKSDAGSREVMHFQYLEWPDEEAGCV